MTPLAGRSTTWWRVVFGLFAILILAPLLFTGPILLLHAIYYGYEGSERLLGSWWGEFQVVFAYAVILSSPFTLIGGGVGWLIAHKTKLNGPLSAIIFGILAGTLGFVFFTVLTGMPQQDILTPEMTEPERIEAVLNMPIDWMLAAFNYALFVVSGTLVALCVWCIGYLGRPMKN